MSTDASEVTTPITEKSRVIVTATAAVGLALTLVFNAVGSLEPAYHNRALHVAKETTAALVLLLVAALLFGRFRRGGRLLDLLALAGVVLLAGKNLVFSVLSAILTEVSGDLTTWRTTGAGMLGAALLAASALAPDRVLRDRNRAFALTAAGCLAALVSLIVIADLFDLPAAFTEEPETRSELAYLSQNTELLVADIGATVLFLVAGIAFGRRAEREGDEFQLWLGVGAIIAAMAYLNYTLFPSAYTDFLYLGDIFRIAAVVAWGVGTIREISRYQGGYARAAVLEERRRVARDIHDGVAQELAFISSHMHELTADVEDKELAEGIMEAVQRALDETRGAISELGRPVHEPLHMALASTAEEITTRLGAAARARHGQGRRGPAGLGGGAAPHPARGGGQRRAPRRGTDHHGPPAGRRADPDARERRRPGVRHRQPAVRLQLRAHRHAGADGVPWRRVQAGVGARPRHLGRGPAPVAMASEFAKPLRVVLVDDHPYYRRELARSLGKSGIEVAAEAPNGEAAIRAVAENGPRRRDHGPQDAGPLRSRGDAPPAGARPRNPRPRAQRVGRRGGRDRGAAGRGDRLHPQGPPGPRGGRGGPCRGGRRVAHLAAVGVSPLVRPALGLPVMPGDEGDRRPAKDEERRRLAEHASQEALFDALLPAQAAVYVKDAEGRYLMVNATVAANVGRPVEEIVGRTDHELVPGELGERLWRADQAIMAAGEPRTVEEPLIMGGRLRTYLSSKAPLRDAGGAIIGIVGVSTPVSSLSEAEEASRRQEVQLAEAQALTGVGSWEWEVATGRQSWSSETFRIVGRDPAEFEPTFDGFLECVHPDDRARLAEKVEKSLDPSSDGSYDVQHRIVRPDGEERSCNCRGRVFFDLDGTPLRVVGAVRDLTEDRRAAAQLARSELQLRIAQELTGIGSWDWDPSTGHVAWSDGMYHIFGLAPGEFDGTFDAAVDRVHPADRAAAEAQVALAMEGGDPGVNEAQIVRPDGELRLLRGHVRAIDIGDAGLRVFGACEDVTERKHEQLELERRALQDPLTNLANRTLTFDRLRHALELAHRRDSTLAVLFIDLDGFKVVNDEHGHEAGDQLLSEAAKRLSTVVRASDTLGRVGGDEFVAVCEDLPTVGAALLAAERVREVLAVPFSVAGSETRLTASIGVALASARHQTPEDILRDADRAMYVAKQHGGDRAELFSLGS